MKKMMLFAPNEDGTGGGGSGGSNDGGSQDGNPPKDDNAGGNNPPKDSQNDDNLPGEDDSMWSDGAKTKAYVKDLRKENAKYRTENKELKTNFSSLNDRFSHLEGGLKKALGLEENVSPEDQIGSLNDVHHRLMENRKR